METEEAADLALGTRLRELRRVRDLTTRELGKRAGVSGSMVSQIENGTVQPSVITLRRLAAGLEVPMADFFNNGGAWATDPRTIDGAGAGRKTRVEGDGAPGAGAAHVVRKSRRKRLQIPGSHLYELCTPSLAWDIELLVVELEPGHPPVESQGHPGQECAVVTEGVMHVVYGDEEFVLEPGDSITFDSTVPHRIENRGSMKVVQYSAITPPWF